VTVAALSLGERWARGLQPADIRAALIEVAAFLDAVWLSELPTAAEIAAKYPADAFMRAIALTRESMLAIAQLQAAQTVTHYLARTPLPWRPGMWKPRLVAFVDRPLHWRAAGKCEGCGVAATSFHSLAIRHRHYRSVGCELPDDLELLCHDCHRARHVYCGVFYADPPHCLTSRCPNERFSLASISRSHA
jgi:hypothetical protein